MKRVTQTMRTAGLVAILALTMTPAQGAFVSPTSVSTDMGSFNANSLVDNLIDGSCLTVPDSLTSDCSAEPLSSQFYWVSQNGQTTGNIDFILDDTLTFEVSGMSIWNLNAVFDGIISDSNVLGYNLFSSQDGGNSFDPDPVVDGGTLTVFGGARAPIGPNQVDFGSPVLANAFRLEITSNRNNGPASGLSEVAFDAVPAPPLPAPATWILIAPVAFLLGLIRRRRR